MQRINHIYIMILQNIMLLFLFKLGILYIIENFILQIIIEVVSMKMSIQS